MRVHVKGHPLAICIGVRNFHRAVAITKQIFEAKSASDSWQRLLLRVKKKKNATSDAAFFLSNSLNYPPYPTIANMLQMCST